MVAEPNVEPLRANVRRPLSCALAGLVVSLLAGNARAQDAGVAEEAPTSEAQPLPASPGPAPAPPAHDVVTGSNLRRRSDDGARPTSVQVVDRSDKSGARRMEDVVAQMSSSNASENDTESGGGQVNLRGLGAGTTLLLLNGRRMLGTGLTQEGQPFYNLAPIPLALVERVEVLKGGASAIYGSDAIAGVVNYVTRRKFDGLTLDVSGNLSTQPGQFRYGEASASWGRTTERGAIIASVSYYERSDLLANDRVYSAGDPDKPPFPFKSMVVPATGIPERYARPLTISPMGNPSAFSFTLPNSEPHPSDPTPASVPSEISELRPDPACRSAPGGTFLQEEAYVEFTSRDQLVGRHGQRCGFSYAPYYGYIFPERRINAYATVEHAFTPHFQAFGEFGYVRITGEGVASPSFAMTQEVVVPSDHPDIPDEWRQDAMNVTTPIRLIGRTRGGRYPDDFHHQTWRDDNFRLVAGLRGDLAEVAAGTWASDFSWEISAAHQQQFSTEHSIDDLTENLRRALNACTETLRVDVGMGESVSVPNPDYGQLPCFHPFYAEQRLNDTDDDNARGVTATEYIIGRSRPSRTATLSLADVVLRGSLLKLPHGELGFAAGAQVRRDAFEFDADRDNELESFAFLVGTPSWKGARNVYAGYAEAGARLLPELEVQAAARYEHYENVGGSANPKFAAKLTPFARSPVESLRRLALHGTFTTSFRGPSLLQLEGRRVNSAIFSGTFRPQRTEGNPNLKPETSIAIDAGASWRYESVELSAEYWHYDYRDIVTIENPQAIWNRCQTALAEGALTGTEPETVAMTDPACFTQSGKPAIQLDSTGVLNSVTAEFINASSTKVHGIDLGATARLGDAQRSGQLSVTLHASYLLSYKGRADRSQRCARDQPTGPGCERQFAGSRNALTFAPALPKLRMSLPVAWSFGGHSVQATGNLVGSFSNDEVSPEEEIPAWFTLNLQYSYRLEGVIGQTTTLTVGATNVADADPPYVQTLLGYDSSQHDPRGRMLFGRLTQEF